VRVGWSEQYWDDVKTEIGRPASEPAPVTGEQAPGLHGFAALRVTPAGETADQTPGGISRGGSDLRGTVD
jgi:hypothetical protein